jgi:hypothetical protein
MSSVADRVKYWEQELRNPVGSVRFKENGTDYLCLVCRDGRVRKGSERFVLKQHSITKTHKLALANFRNQDDEQSSVSTPPSDVEKPLKKRERSNSFDQVYSRRDHRVVASLPLKNTSSPAVQPDAFQGVLSSVVHDLLNSSHFEELLMQHLVRSGLLDDALKAWLATANPDFSDVVKNFLSTSDKAQELMERHFMRWLGK